LTQSCKTILKSLLHEHAIFRIQTNFLIFINVAYLRAYQPAFFLLFFTNYR